MSTKKLDILLIGEQDDRDTKRDDLDADDFASIGDDFALDYKQDMQPVPVIMGSFGNHEHVPGTGRVDFSGMTYLSDNGTSAPMFESLLLSCGFAVAVDAGERTYTPSSDQSDWTYLSAWKHSGAKANGECLITKAHSMLCDGVIEGVLGEPVKLSCTGMGVPDGAPALGNYITCPSTFFDDTIPVMLNASTMEAHGALYDIIGFSVAFKNVVELQKHISSTYPHGHAYADIRGRDFEVKLTVVAYAINPYTAFAAGTVGSFNIAIGATGAVVRVYSPSSGFQITDIAPGENEGINTYEITGILRRDDFAIKTGETLA